MRVNFKKKQFEVDSLKSELDRLRSYKNSLKPKENKLLMMI